jgi:pyridoxine kinase
MPQKLVTIAGSDALAGGGLQADLATFTEQGYMGLSVITSIVTIQPDDFTIFPIASDVLRSQLDSTLALPDIAGIKIGFLPTVQSIQQVAQAVAPFGEAGIPIVVDPVMAFKETTAQQSALVEAIQTHLMPLATLLTPNLAEASLLVGRPLHNLADMKRAAHDLQAAGARAVIIKGGNRVAGEMASDLFMTDTKQWTLQVNKLPQATVNGAGCTFAAHLTTSLAAQQTLLESVVAAKQFVYAGIQHGVKIGNDGNVWQAAQRLKYHELTTPTINIQEQNQDD